MRRTLVWLRPGGAPNEEDEVEAMEAEVALVADAEDQMGVGMAATPNPRGPNLHAIGDAGGG